MDGPTEKVRPRVRAERRHPTMPERTLHFDMRPLVRSDWSEVAEIYRQGILTGDATFETEPPGWEEWTRSKVEHSRIVAVETAAPESGRERVVGFGALSPTSSRCVYEGVCEVMVYVAEGWRECGVGSLLLGAMIRSSEEAGVWTLLAGVFPENVASIRLHEALGFRTVGVHRRIGRMADGRWRDTVLLERRSESVGTD